MKAGLGKAIAALADEALPEYGQLLAATNPVEFLNIVREKLVSMKKALRTGRHYTELYGQKFPQSGATDSLREIDKALDTTHP